MPPRPPRSIDLVATQVRTAALVAGALLLGATGALAATAPDVVRFSPTSETVSLTEATTEAIPETTDTATATDTATTTATDTSAVTATVTQTQTSTATVTETSTATETEDAEEKAMPGAAPVACADATNHGQYVSSVARSVEAGPGHGAAVREAAHSDCGKKPKGPEQSKDTGEGRGSKGKSRGKPGSGD